MVGHVPTLIGMLISENLFLVDSARYLRCSKTPFYEVTKKTIRAMRAAEN